MTTETKIDGRRLRSVRTRRAIVDALLALIEEGDLKPTAPKVAERAEVSLRTVFQHFAEVEALFAAVSERQIERVAEHYELIDPGGPFPERLDRFVTQRAWALEFVTPVARAAQVKEPFAPSIKVETDRLRELNRQELAHTFAPELAEVPSERLALLLPALEALSVWRMWETLRADLGLDQERARTVMRHQIAALFAAEGITADD